MRATRVLGILLAGVAATIDHSTKTGIHTLTLRIASPPMPLGACRLSSGVAAAHPVKTVSLEKKDWNERVMAGYV